MTIQTNFDYSIVSFDEHANPNQHPRLVDADQLHLVFEFPEDGFPVDDSSTIRSYSDDDDSTMEPFDAESDRFDFLLDAIEIPLAGTSRRLTTRRSLEERIKLVGIETQLLSNKYMIDMLDDEDSVRLAKTRRVPLLHRNRIDQNADNTTPISSPIIESTIRQSPSSQKLDQSTFC